MMLIIRFVMNRLEVHRTYGTHPAEKFVHDKRVEIILIILAQCEQNRPAHNNARAAFLARALLCVLIYRY
jgi:hypothetical protein